MQSHDNVCPFIHGDRIYVVANDKFPKRYGVFENITGNSYRVRLDGHTGLTKMRREVVFPAEGEESVLAEMAKSGPPVKLSVYRCLASKTEHLKMVLFLDIDNMMQRFTELRECIEKLDFLAFHVYAATQHTGGQLSLLHYLPWLTIDLCCSKTKYAAISDITYTAARLDLMLPKNVSFIFVTRHAALTEVSKKIATDSGRRTTLWPEDGDNLEMVLQSALFFGSVM